jgi:sigma-B regulation protein RsbU (phosphoserine phosphatase)
MRDQRAAMPGLRIQVYEKQELVHSVECPGSAELGRQAEGEAGPYLTRQEGDRWRVVIARLDEVLVSRRFLAAEPLTAGRARLTNLSRNLPVGFLDGSQLGPGASREMAMPVFLVVGDRKIGIQSADTAAVPLHTAPVASPVSAPAAPRKPAFALLEDDPATPLQTLAEATIPPGSDLARHHPRLVTSAAASELQNETMIRWLQAAMDVLQSAASSSEFFDKAAAAMVDLVDLDSGQVLLVHNGTWQLQAHKSAAHDRLGDERLASRNVLRRILNEKRTFWQVPAQVAPQGSLVGLNAVVAAPILDKSGTVIGALYGDRQARGFSAGLPPITKLQALLVELLAGGVAAGVARIEREQAELQRQKKFLLYERELQIGRKIQVGFLPETLPEPPGWEIVAHFQPAREVAGDFYDVFPLSTGHVAIVMADVCDKGVGAALFMALFRSLIRAFCMHSPLMGLMENAGTECIPRSSGAVMPACRRRASLFGDLIALLTVENTNKYVTSNHASAFMFVTLFVGILDTASGELSYVNAGHEPPIIVGPHGIKTRLQPTGPVVGVLPEASFDLGKTRLERGDILLTHTDGVTDARDPAGKSFSEKRFLALLEGGAPSAAALVERIVSDVRSHIGSADQFDDITLLAVRRAPEASNESASAVAPTPHG